MSDYVLHVTPGSSPCRAVLLVAEILRADNDLPLEVCRVDLRAQDHLADSFLALNPLHTVPTLARVGVDDAPSQGLRESRAIMRFLCDGLSVVQELYPESPWPRAQVDALLDWDVGTFYPAISGFAYPQVFRDEIPDDAAIHALRDVLHFLDRHQLADGSPHLIGDRLTLADLSVGAGLATLELVSDNVVSDDYPNVLQWRDRLRTMPAWQDVHAPFEAWKADLRA